MDCADLAQKHGSVIYFLEFGIWNLEFGIWNLEFGIWNLEFDHFVTPSLNYD